ncbi:MAG: hypothetical protein JRJ87_15390 [Deltaproteobacteria bacterium]|nr:hypothetical protein [Deltaproteobacteria bacterium]
MYRLAPKFLIVLALLGGCGAETTQAVLTIIEGDDNMPCLGVRRFRVTAFENEVDGKSVEVFGEYYDSDGRCNLPAGLLLELPDLPYSQRMWILVEGCDSSEKRRMCMGQTDVLAAENVKSGDLGKLTLQRERISDEYPIGTLVISELPELTSFPEIDRLVFILNAGTPGYINGSLKRNPQKDWSEMKIVLSSLVPRLGNSIHIVAYQGTDQMATWEAEDPFDILEGEMLFDVVMKRTGT